MPPASFSDFSSSFAAPEGNRPRFFDFPARHKLAAAVLLAFAVAPLQSFVLALAALGTAVACAACAVCFGGISARGLLRSLGRVNIFFALLFAVMPFSLSPDTFSGTPLFSLGPLHWHGNGFTAALLAFCKGNAIALFFLCLPGASAFSLNCKALLELGAPVKLVTLIQLVARHAASFAREFEGMRTAAKLRGFAPRFSLRDIRTIAWLTGMLFVRCHDKNLRMEQAMRLRGFTGAFPLLPPPEQASVRAGAGLVCASGIFALALLCFNYLPALS